MAGPFRLTCDNEAERLFSDAELPMPRNATARNIADGPLLAGLSERAFDPSEPIPQEVQPIIQNVLQETVYAGQVIDGSSDIEGRDTAAEILTLRLLAMLRDVVRQLPASRRAKAYHDAVWTLKGND